MPNISASSTSSGGTAVTKRHKPPRSVSASQIARNSKHFETWATHESLASASYHDIPDGFSGEIADIFCVSGRLPLTWVQSEPNPKLYRRFRRKATPGFLAFIRKAYEQCPSLFSEDVDIDPSILHEELIVVFRAWERLLSMINMPEENWSEADFVANVYTVFRSAAIQASTYRVQRPIALPEPVFSDKLSKAAVRILATKQAIPDCTVLIQPRSIRGLHSSDSSPFNVLQRTVKCGSPTKASSFRFQCTPFVSVPEAPSFEFVSSIWEDKKPLHPQPAVALRQNRMSTASAARHLHSFHVVAPVIGLVWAHGKVRAHVDWCKRGDTLASFQLMDSIKLNVLQTVLSAPYPGPGQPETDRRFHEWCLDQPADILQVYFLIKNIDRWTAGPFRKRVVDGVHDLMDHIGKKQKAYRPWRREGELRAMASPTRKENIPASHNSPGRSFTRRNKRCSQSFEK